MSNGNQKRTRSERVAALDLPPNMLERTMLYLRSRDVLLRIGLCALAALAMWALMRGWNPPFPYRTGDIPQRGIIPRVSFEVPDEKQTNEDRNRAKTQAIYLYINQPEELTQRQAELVDLIAKAATAPTLEEFGPKVWDEFFPAPNKDQVPSSVEQKKALYQQFREAFSGEGTLQKFTDDLNKFFLPYEQRGLMQELPPDHKGNQVEIDVKTAGPDSPIQRVRISEVLAADAVLRLQRSLQANLRSPEIVDLVFTWFQKRLPTTLKWDKAASLERADKDAREVKTVYKQYNTENPMVKIDALTGAIEPLDAEDLELLQAEDKAYNAQTSFSTRLNRSLAVLGMFLALYVLCGYYIHHRERSLIISLRRLSLVLGLSVLTLGLCIFAGRDQWRAELIPLLIFGMTIAIAYQQELGLLLSAALSLVVVMALGQGLSEFVVLLGAAAGAILMLGRIRSRSKLIHVGLCAGLVAMLTTLGVNILDQHPIDSNLLIEAGRTGLWAVVAGFLMTGLLPLIERIFEVLTDISLLELGDIAHPLLQELVRRAPGTYNHSINVASIAEAAAESIGAHGLLTRIGAYFHDIGKMLKPSYFVENQGSESNRHETLLPAMSTLIIIAHIKDGADLARQHHLPQPIIDFIQQHHGTTLVEYFYRRASEKSEADPNAADVEEHNFRYPGPKPQTKEAGVLMLADAVESASRSLVDPTPSRIESLVDEIAMKRLLDGQFDECGLTLEELRTVEDSLVKSLTAVYHGRVKYPEQRTA